MTEQTRFNGVSEQGRNGLLWTIFDGAPFAGRRVASFSEQAEALAYLNWLNAQNAPTPPDPLADLDALRLPQVDPEWMFGPSVEARNALQRSGKVHPYTCGNDECRTKTRQAPLLAVEGGWLCEHCGYTQKTT